jgi:hypothetical protein
VAACPAGAITGSGFTNEQILSQIEGLLMFSRRSASLVDMAEAVPV